MRNPMTRTIALCLSVLLCVLCVSCAGAEGSTESQVVVTVNGTPVYQVEIDAVVNEYLTQFAYYGYDTTDETLVQTVKEYAVQLCIKTVLVDKDMADCGAYNMVDESVFAEAGELAYSMQLEEYTQYLITNYGFDSELATSYAGQMLQSGGYTVAYYTEYYRQLTAMEKYKTWLMRDEAEITDADITAEFDARVAAGTEGYADAELTDELKNTLKEEIYATRASEKVQERTSELLAAAEIVYTEQ